MAILAEADRIILHGIANSLARFQCEEILRHGTRLAGIVARAPEELEGWAPPTGTASPSMYPCMTRSSSGV